MSYMTLAQMKTAIANSGMPSEMQTVLDVWVSEIWGSANTGCSAAYVGTEGQFVYNGAEYEVAITLNTATTGPGYTTLAEFETAVAASGAPSGMQSVADIWVSAIWGSANTGITFSYNSGNQNGNIYYYGAVYVVNLTLLAI